MAGYEHLPICKKATDLAVYVENEVILARSIKSWDNDLNGGLYYGKIVVGREISP
jgi:hypothetical protein